MPTYLTYNAGDVFPASSLNNNIPKVSVATKLFLGGPTAVTTDASGYVTVTHGAGFTPLAVFVAWQGNALGGGPGGFVGADTVGATTFRTRNASATAATSTIVWLCIG